MRSGDERSFDPDAKALISTRPIGAENASDLVDVTALHHPSQLTGRAGSYSYQLAHEWGETDHSQSMIPDRLPNSSHSR